MVILILQIPMPDDSPMEIVDDKELDEDDHFEDVDEIKGVTNIGVLKAVTDTEPKDELSVNESSEICNNEEEEERKNEKEAEAEENEEGEKLISPPPPKRMKWTDKDEPPPPGIDDDDDFDDL